MKTFQQIFDERLVVSENMERWGGGFVSTLAMLIIKADRENLIKIHNTWPDYWETYLSWGK